jgi:hypothetical protein
VAISAAAASPLSVSAESCGIGDRRQACVCAAAQEHKCPPLVSSALPPQAPARMQQVHPAGRARRKELKLGSRSTGTEKRSDFSASWELCVTRDGRKASKESQGTGTARRFDPMDHSMLGQLQEPPSRSNNGIRRWKTGRPCRASRPGETASCLHGLRPGRAAVAGGGGSD